MVKLVQPQENVIQSRAQIGAGAAQAPGLAQAQAGRSVEQLGQQYFQEARQADQTITYSNAMTQATEEYTMRAKERMSRPTDENGTPNYSSLVEDVGAIGKDIKNSIGSTIIDPEVRRRFELEFNRFDSNQRIQAFSAARKHQINYGRASLHQNMRKRQEAAVQVNPDQLGFYEDQTRKELATARDSGLISPAEHDSMVESFRSVVRKESYRNMIKADPAKVRAELNFNEAAELGLKPREQEQLLREAEGAIEDAQREAIKQERAAEKARADAVSQKVTSFKVAYAEQEAGIAAAGPSLQDLEAVRPEIGEENYLKLLKEHLRVQKKESREGGALGKLSDAISRGEDVSTFASKTVDQHLDRTVQAFEQGKGEPATLQEIAGIASGYGRQVRSFAKKMNSSLLEGSLDQAQDALSAYTASRDHKSKALEGNAFTNKAEEVGEYAELLIERGGVQPQEAIEIARQRVLSKKDDVAKALRQEFNKIKRFKGTNIKETLQDELDLETFFFNDDIEIPTDVLNTYRTFLQEAYVSTGGEINFFTDDAAVKIANARMQKTHGITEVGGKKAFMFAPPEKEFPNIDPSTMTQQLHNDVAPILPEGVDVSQVSIFADETTKGNFITTDLGQRAEIVSYGVQYTKTLADGSQIELPVVNPQTGEPVAWFPSQEAAAQQALQAQQEGVERARSKREEMLGAQQKQRQELTAKSLTANPSATLLKIRDEANSPEFKDRFLQIWNPEQDEQGLSSEEKKLMDSLVTTGKSVSPKQMKLIRTIMFNDPLRFEELF
jgi:hypothetical protein